MTVSVCSDGVQICACEAVELRWRGRCRWSEEWGRPHLCHGGRSRSHGAHGPATGRESDTSVW